MATEEAKAMLDALMGADRNAPLPVGAAVPTKTSRSGVKRDRSEGGLVLPGKRHRSCYDKDIDPLYTAWGIDVYELFVNTKSDLGANPYIVDKGAHAEFVKLAPPEQERLGYHYFLFQKLSELVRQCDRTVNRNKEKLKQELSRKLSQRGGQDFVEDVDEGAVDALAHAIVQLEDYMTQLQHNLTTLNEIVGEEDVLMNRLEPLLHKGTRNIANNVDTSSTEIKDSSDGNDNIKEEPLIDESNVTKDDETGPDQNMVKTEDVDVDVDAVVKSEIDKVDRFELEQIQMDLGKLTLQRQRLLYDIGRLLSQIAPLQDTVETQRRQLNYVRSDISTDKTVCDVSGNFMSARDADERIAAHYAGKQYVGWKLVRDKYASMMKKYGHYGPPPPGQRGGMENNSNSNSSRPPMSFGGGGGNRSGGGDGRRGGNSGGGRFDSSGGGGGGGGYRGGGGGPPPNRGGGGGGPPERGRWERGGGGGGGGQGAYPDRGPPRGPPPPQRGSGEWRR
jgi:LUC7 N_terminus